MNRRLGIIAVLAIAVSAAAHAQSDNMIHVKAYPGNDVGAKVKAAMQDCGSSPIPCMLVVDASLASAPSGTMPTLCANCSLVDYRAGAPDGALNSSIVVADRYCANASILDQTCIQNAIDALPEGGTVLLRPGQIYTINSCTSDADATWGILIDNQIGLRLEGWGATIVQNVNNSACAAIDLRGSMNSVVEGPTLLTNYSGVGTALRIHRNAGSGQQLRGNSFRSLIIGGVGTAFTPAGSFSIGIDNGFTDAGQVIDNQTFFDITFHGNTTNILQRGLHMTNQLYVNMVAYDNATTGIVHVNIQQGDATFIRPTLNVFPASGNTNAWVFGAQAGNVSVEDVYSEVNNDSGPYIVDQGSYGSSFRGGKIFFFGTGGTVGVPVTVMDLSLAQPSAIYAFDGVSIGTPGGGWKAVKYPASGLTVIQHSSGWGNIEPSNQANAAFLGDAAQNTTWADGTFLGTVKTAMLRAAGFINPSVNTYASVEQGYDGSEGIIQVFDRAGASAVAKPLWLNKGTGQPVLADYFQIGAGTAFSGNHGTAVNAQHSDGTGASHIAAFNAVGDTTDGGTGTAGKATCWKTTGTLGYCSTQPDATGACTCN